VDPLGDLLFTDSSKNAVRLVAAATCATDCPYGLPAMTAGDLYALAGTGTSGFSGDGGAGTAAMLNLPDALAGDGDAYIGDAGNDRVRELTAAPLASTTTVACSPATVAPGSASTCTATVSDVLGTASGSSPSGRVEFQAGSGPAESCVLAATEPGAAACAESFTPTAVGPV